MSVDRARHIIGHLRELKVQLGGEIHGVTTAEHEAVQEMFGRMARLTSRLERVADEAAVVQTEIEQVRPAVVEQRDLLQRRHLNVATPPWRAPASRDGNLVFFSGPDSGRATLAELAGPLHVDLNARSYTGDAAAVRWGELRAAGAAIFDVSRPAPQVHYDLGVALTLGTAAVVLAQEGTRLPFDVGQDAITYAPDQLAGALAAALDTALYGVTAASDPRSSVDAAVDYARRLAREQGTDLAMTLFDELPERGADPLRAHSLLRLLDPFVPDCNLMVLRSRWAASFPTDRRCFVIMPFREELSGTWTAVVQAGGDSGVRVERGDVAAGQEVIASIWHEIGRSTEVVVDLTGFNPNVCIELGMADTLGRPALLIGAPGTELEVADRLPSLAKRRCNIYHDSDDLTPLLTRFFAGELTWA